MGKILKLHTSLLQKEISAKEITKEYLSAIKLKNSAINAYVNLTEEEALLGAENVDRKIAEGKVIDVLSGIPMAIKDNISTKDIFTTCCSEMLNNYKPIYNATVWQKLKDKDAVILGKTNMDEFAMGSSTEVSIFGATKNPHNINFVAGGSSGGSSAAVAADLAVYALGSDTGGSIRQPAAFCGVVGLKPTYGAVSRYGLIAYASSLDTVGIIAKDVEDTALVFDRISGFDALDSTSKKDFSPSAFKTLDNDIKGIRIGVPKEFLEKACSKVKNATLKALDEFENMGAFVEIFSMKSLEFALHAYYIITAAEVSSNLGRFDGVRFGKRAESFESFHKMVSKTRGDYFGDKVKKHIMLGTFVLSEGNFEKYYAKACNFRNKLKYEFKKIFEKYDVLVTPTTLDTAFKIGQLKEDKDANFYADYCTVSTNLAGLPAVSLPLEKDENGLPIGLQIIGGHFKENLILNVARSFEKSRKDTGVSL